MIHAFDDARTVAAFASNLGARAASWVMRPTDISLLPAAHRVINSYEPPYLADPTVQPAH